MMARLHPNTEDAVAAAFISNCQANNFRLQALEMLENLNIKIGSYGLCHQDHDGDVDKDETLRHYKFSLAFENSNEKVYITEKFFQSLVAGAVLVVIGAPNVQDFSPSPGSVLHIRDLEDVTSIATTMKHLATNPDAYSQTVLWKHRGPSDSFKALIDMASVHSSCRLCIFLATKIQEAEERSASLQKPTCRCSSSSGTVLHLFVREKGRFKFESIYLRSSKVILEALHSETVNKFRSMNYTPVWKNERPECLRGGEDLQIYRINPVGMTHRQALYSFQF